MAVVQRNKKDTMSIRVITSVDAGGVAKTADRNVANVNPVMTDEEIYTMGTALGGLLNDETDSIHRTLKYELENQA